MPDCGAFFVRVSERVLQFFFEVCIASEGIGGTVFSIILVIIEEVLKGGFPPFERFPGEQVPDTQDLACRGRDSVVDPQVSLGLGEERPYVSSNPVVWLGFGELGHAKHSPSWSSGLLLLELLLQLLDLLPHGC